MILPRRLEKATLSDVLRPTVSPEQERFVASAAVTIAQSMFEPDSEVLGLWVGDRVVGLMATIDDKRPEAGSRADEATDSLYLWRLLIDEKEQRKGYGSQALKAFLNQAGQKRKGRVTLTVLDAPGTAIPFYQSHGFIRTGRIIEGEVQMARTV